jgi:geranylgeranyl pyrophosphate synthase
MWARATLPMSEGGTSSAWSARVGAYQQRTEQVLDRYLTLADPGTPRLLQAMRYSVLGGGKRLRPILVYCAGEALGAPLSALDAPAAAVELIHAYSLIHDDLPAMDDDDLRRGQPTCHKAFDEGTAILAGDALQALAFAVLADDSSPGIGLQSRLNSLRQLAHGIGTAGMAGGQALDLEAVGRQLTLTELEQMHRRKTGALITTSVLLGAYAANIGPGAHLTALQRYGDELGLAFQIQDDILDVTGDVAAIGKQPGADAARAKPTYPSLMGLTEAQALALAARDRAIASLSGLGLHTGLLEGLAHFVVDRSH